MTRFLPAVSAAVLRPRLEKESAAIPLVKDPAVFGLIGDCADRTNHAVLAVRSDAARSIFRLKFLFGVRGICYYLIG